MMYPYGGLLSTFAICCTALVGILFISGGFFLPFFLRNEQTKYPNGPRPLGFLGNFFTLSRLLSSPDQELLSLARRFGDVCMLWYGSNPVMIINTPRAARDLLTEVCRSHTPNRSFPVESLPLLLIRKLERCSIFITSGTERISQPDVALQIGYHSRRGKLSLPSQALSLASEPSTVRNFSKVSGLRVQGNAW